MDELKKINFELPKITFEDEISKWKEFYLKYLYHLKGDRNAVLSKLQTLYQGYQIFANRKTLLGSETVKLDIETEDLIQKSFKYKHLCSKYLETAKQAVEMVIEKDEKTAIQYINSNI